MAMPRRPSGIVALVAAGLIAWPLSAAGDWADVVKIYDGDTITVVIAGQRERIRIANIDAPEIGTGARCPYEASLAEQSRDAVVHMISQAKNRVDLTFEPRRYDRYGRGLARVSANGTDIGEDLIRLGLARRWDGRRHPWC